MLFQYYLNTSIVFINILNEVKTNINLVYEQKKFKKSLYFISVPFTFFLIFIIKTNTLLHVKHLTNQNFSQHLHTIALLLAWLLLFSSFIIYFE